MVVMTTAMQQTLARDVAVTVKSRAYIEFNCNRYFEVTPSNVVEDYDVDLFPISSICLPDRPKKAGVVKAMMGDSNDAAVSRATNTGEAMFNTGYTTGPRYYYVTPEDKYTYWVSPDLSSLTATSGSYPITNVSPQILYTAPVATNKIVIGLENSWASPVIHGVDITTDGTTWTAVATNPTVDSSGRIVLYLQANSTWSTTVNYSASTLIRGIRYRVTAINKKNTRLNVIEIGARMEADITPYLIDYSYEASVSEHSFVTPIGTVSANTGSISLSNITGIFNNANTASPFAGMIDANAHVRVETGIDTSGHAGPGVEWLRVMTMRTDVWSPGDIDKITVSLKDDSKRLQEVKPSPTLFENASSAATKDGYSNMTVGEVIWRLLDSVGYNNYQYDPVLDNQTSIQIPFFWTNGEKTVWEVFAELAQATQTAIYFDRYNVLQIKTMAAAYASSAQPVWDFTSGVVSAEKTAGYIDSLKLSDIITVDPTYDYEANTVNVKYKPTTMTDENSRTPAMEVVWEPDGTFALRSSPLAQTYTPSSSAFVMAPGLASSWPYTGVVQIQGEFIRYTGKGYSYYNANGVLTNTYVASQEEKTALDALNPSLNYKNYFNGFFRTPTGSDNRGIWNTNPANHTMPTNWSVNRYKTGSGGLVNWTGGIKYYNSRKIMSGRSDFKQNTWYVSTYGSQADVEANYFGTRIKFPTSGYNFGAAGILIGADTNDSGIYVELARTSAAAPQRAIFNELNIYLKKTDGFIRRFGQGVAVPVVPGVYYDLDVKINSTTDNTGVVVNAKVNGISKNVVTIPNSELPTPTDLSGRQGIFTRGWTIAEFEYFYAVRTPINDAFDQEGWFDRVSGGFQSGQWDREWVYSYTTRWYVRGKTRTKVVARNNARYFEDFGPWVHEVREMDVKFNKTPVIHSRIYFSNDTQVICPEYTGDAFGAKFLLANTARQNAILNGEDTLMFGADNPVDQKMFIYGRTVTQADEQVITVKDDLAIKKRGVTSVDIDSQWIQSKTAAQRIADWIVGHWSGGVDEINITVFANPLVNLGDIVTVTHKYANDPAAPQYINYQKYFIVEISDGGSKEGPTQTLTLRKVKV